MKKIIRKIKNFFGKSKKHSERVEKKIARVATIFFFLFGIFFSFRTPTITGNVIVEGSSFYSTNLIGILLIFVSFTLLIVLSKKD